MRTLAVSLMIALGVVHFGCQRETEAMPPEEKPTNRGNTVGESTTLVPGAEVGAEQKKAGILGKTSIEFNNTEYVHRWSQKGHHEYTPVGQQDLSKWTDMLTVIIYRDVADAEGLALRANKVLEEYKNFKGVVLTAGVVPQTTEKPAEHLIVVAFGDPKFLEAVQARFMLANGKGVAIIHCHRVYGNQGGPEMVNWLKSRGPSMEKTLLEWKRAVPVVTQLLKNEDAQVTKAPGEAVEKTKKE